MDKRIKGSHGGTYGGIVVSCTAAAPNSEILEGELVENGARLGEK
jgi:acetylornithine/succinyldiaminopimelate/putrescine aminotransferase